MGKRTEIILIIGIVGFILSFQFSSAEIIISQPEAVYNLGDDFSFNIKIKPLQDTSDFLTSTLVCKDNEIEFYKNPFDLEKGEEKEFTVTASLGKFITENKVGECYIRAIYGQETAISQNFQISDEVIITLNLQGSVFAPGDAVKVYGNIEKERSTFNGIVEIKLLRTNVSFYGSSEDGSFNFNFTVPDNTPSGLYDLEAKAYEKDSEGNIINQGITKDILKVKQVIESIEIALNSISVVPETEFRYSVLVHDQAKEDVKTDVAITITLPNGEQFEKKIIRTGEDNSIVLSIQSNFAPGYWKISTELNELKSEKSFLIEEYEKLDYNLTNNSLMVTNVGNINYNGPIEVKMGEYSEVVDIRNLNMGQSINFELRAPDGEYVISIGEGNRKRDLGITFLTGNAISIEPSTKKTSNYFMIFWVLLVAILIAATLYVRKNIIARKSPLTQPKLTKADMSKARSDLILDKGQKKEALIVSVHIKNYEELKSDPVALKAVDSAIWQAVGSGASRYDQGDHKILVFANLKQQQEHTIKSLTTAQSVFRSLNAYNSINAKKVNFGIGANLGMLIFGETDGKMSFASYGSVVTGTKKIASVSSGNILLSDDLHRKLIGKVKMQKLPDSSFWQLEKIVDRSAHSEFIEKFKQNLKSN